MFGLIDCNNFYVSCERLFRPDLHRRPLIVLSNNDGCVIARSNEVKPFIGMGEPYFKVKSLCEKHKVAIFSSNYSLYGDLSERVMSVIESLWPHVEIYSIDEAFIDLSTLPSSLHDTFCRKLQKTILQYTGIPTSIGIGQTKTLAKLANGIAKKELKVPVFNISQERSWLNRIDVQEVWGVGRKLASRLISMGIKTAADLALAERYFLRKNFSVVLVRTAIELSGRSCFGLENPVATQSITSSRSFSTRQTEFEVLAEALSYHTACAWHKVRRSHLVVHYIQVFIRTSPYQTNALPYSNTTGFQLVNPTDDLRLLTHYAKTCLRKIYKPGIKYQKIGVVFNDLQNKQARQLDLFHEPSNEKLANSEKVMNAIEAIQHKFGENAISLAAQGFRKSWAMKRNLKSPSYTTSWNELPVVYAR